MTLTYANDWGLNAGKTITVPRYEYNNDRRLLMSESGNVHTIKCRHSESVRDIASLFRSERNRRMSLSIGSTDEHLKKLAGILAEVRKDEPAARERREQLKKQRTRLRSNRL